MAGRIDPGRALEPGMRRVTPQVIRFGRYRVEISNPRKILFPGDGVSKSDLIAYYRDVAGFMLPFLEDRPLTMRRFPDGIESGGFFQKEIGDYFPDWIHRVEVPKKGGTTRYVVCNTAATLAYLANQAMIAAHVWPSRTGALDRPDQMVFDLDPSDGDFEPVRFAAHALKELLDDLDLPSFVKTTGSRGAHVVVPLDRRTGFDEVRAFARNVAGILARREPRRLTVEQRRARRGGRVYLDTGSNAYGQTVVAPYSVRPVGGAPVGVPIEWDELNDRQLHSRTYTLWNVHRRLDRAKAPWQGMRRRAVGIGNRQHALEDLLSIEGAS